MSSVKPGRAETAQTAQTAIAALWERYHYEERAIVAEALREAGSLNGAARILGIQPSSLQRILQRHPELDAERREQSRAA